MSYESTKVVKTLRFPGDESTQYQVNAVALDGHSYSEIDQRFNSLESFDALRYMGTVAAGETAPGGFTVAANKGDVYKVTSSGYVMGAKVEIGDMLICNADNTAAADATNYTTIAANWDIVQANVDVEAILAHTHVGEVTFVKSNKTLEHVITPTKKTITAEFVSGAATVTGDHGHTASGSVTITPGGTIDDQTITPEGNVTLTTPSTKGANDAEILPTGNIKAATNTYVTGVSVDSHAAHTHEVNGTVTIAQYTPEGTVEASNEAVTSVEAGNTSVSAHKVNESTAGGFTPTGSVAVVDASAAGTVESHKHNVAINTESGSHTAVSAVTSTYDEQEQILTIGTTTSTGTYLTSVDVTEDYIAPVFTGTAHSHTASFTGDAVSGHTHNVSVDNHDEFVPNISVTKNNHSHGFTGTAATLTASHNLSTAANTTGMDHTVNATTETSAHTHTFEGSAQYLHASFAGTAATHKHGFTGADSTHTVTVNVNNFSGSFNGSASGNVNVVNGADVLTDVAIANHTISTVDSGSFETEAGKQ